MHTLSLRWLATVFVLFTILIAGCDDDDWKSGFNRTATPTASPSPSPTQAHAPHSILRVGSTASGEGQLIVHLATPPQAFVEPSACVGGTGEDCEGGTIVYTGTSPGFDDIRTTDNPPPHRIADGVEVTIELTAVEPGASVTVSGTVLDAAGESAVVNATGHLHNHPVWQLLGSGDVEPEPKHISFRLHADGFDSSAELTVQLEVFDGQVIGEPHS